MTVDAVRPPLPPLTFRQKILLSVVVPAFFLVIAELLARGTLAIIGEKPKDAPTKLEMPTWMLNDANAMARRAPSGDAVEWLTLFQEGSGYRVNLVPNVSRRVKNTFSLIPADEENRYLIESNSLGFRSREVSPKKTPDTFRILVFGDSSSFGWGVDAEKSWSVLLEKELGARFAGTKFEVANFAIPGDSSAYGKLLFDTFAPKYEADLVILGFGANDAKAVITSHTEQVSRFQSRSSLLSVASALKHSAIYRVLESTLQSRPTANQAPPTKRVPAVNQGDYAANLTYMGTKAKELGSRNTLLLSLCTPASYSRTARTVAKKNAFLWMNGQGQLMKALPEIVEGKLYPAFVSSMQSRYPNELRQNRLFYITSDGCHPNELGHQLVADRLVDLIASSPLLSKN